MGFADLKKRLGIDSSGHLSHHLSKLNGLIKTDSYGAYSISDQGKDALFIVQTVESHATKDREKLYKKVDLKSWIKPLIILLTALLLLSSFFAFDEYVQSESFQNIIVKQDNAIQDLQTQLKNALNELTIQPTIPHYLTIGGLETKLFLVSAKPKYSTWQINDTNIGYPAYTSSSNVIHQGDPVFMITVTVRNDYIITDAENLTEINSNAPIGNITGSYSSFIILTAQLFSQNGSIVKTVDITQPKNTLAGYEFNLNSGETTSFNLLFETGSHDIGRYDIFALYVSSLPQP